MSTETAAVITIDGPAGSGKSTLADTLAETMGWEMFDSGSTYRAVAYVARALGIDLRDGVACGIVASKLIPYLVIPKKRMIVVKGVDLSREIRLGAVGKGASDVGVHQSVRDALLPFQQSYALRGNCVIEGRDAATVICPNARLKIYLTASPEVRAARRGESGADLIAQRDKQDSTRTASPLMIADGSVVIDSSNRTPPDIAAEIQYRYQQLNAA